MSNAEACVSPKPSTGHTGDCLACGGGWASRSGWELSVKKLAFLCFLINLSFFFKGKCVCVCVCKLEDNLNSGSQAQWQMLLPPEPHCPLSPLFILDPSWRRSRFLIHLQSRCQQVDHWEFEASLFYILSSRASRASQWALISKQTSAAKTNNKQAIKWPKKNRTARPGHQYLSFFRIVFGHPGFLPQGPVSSAQVRGWVCLTQSKMNAEIQELVTVRGHSGAMLACLVSLPGDANVHLWAIAFSKVKWLP